MQFDEDGWDMQRLIKRLLTSHAYRQLAVTPALLEKDPENRLLARGPRYRLDASVARPGEPEWIDGAHARRARRESYQPPNIWEPVGFAKQYAQLQGSGDDLYRRHMPLP